MNDSVYQVGSKVRWRHPLKGEVFEGLVVRIHWEGWAEVSWPKEAFPILSAQKLYPVGESPEARRKRREMYLRRYSLERSVRNPNSGSRRKDSE